MNDLCRQVHGEGKETDRAMTTDDSEIPLIRLCSTIENQSLPYDDDLQPPSIEFWESLLLDESLTIRKLLHRKQSIHANFDKEDVVAWDQRSSNARRHFFTEGRGVYMDRLVQFAATDEGHFLGVMNEAQEVLKLTIEQCWQGVHNWMNWIGGKELQIYGKTIEDTLKVGLFLGAQREYLDELTRQAQQTQQTHGQAHKHQSLQTPPMQQISQNQQVASSGRTCQTAFSIIPEVPTVTAKQQRRTTSLWKVEIPPAISTVAKQPNSRDQDMIRARGNIFDDGGDVQASRSCIDSQEGAAKQSLEKIISPTPAPLRQSQIDLEDTLVMAKTRPRIRIFVNSDLPDIPFNDPQQPLYLDLPEDILCRHSTLMRQALEKKRDKKANFDTEDEMIWDPETSTTKRNFPPPYPVVYLEGIVICLCDPSATKWIKEKRKEGETTKDYAILVKRHLSRNVGEVWDALKTWIAWIRDGDIILFPAERAKRNACRVGKFLGATEQYLQELEEHNDPNDVEESDKD